MAFDFSKITGKLQFFSKMGARARIATLAAGVAGAIFVMYLAVQYMSGESGTGASSVARAPGDVQSVPGGELTPEYYRALQQANSQAAQQAKISGGSAIPTLVNVGQGGPAVQQSPTGNCNIICSDEDVNVKGTLDEYVRQGQLSPEVSAVLQALSEKKVSVDDYAAELDHQVKESKLTPEQARKLLEQYMKQYANEALKESAKAMDGMIKSGDLPLDVANFLLESQKKNISPAAYAAESEKIVKEGKISKSTAQLLLAQYTQQKAKAVIARSVASLKALARNGQLTPEVETALIDLENRMVPVSQYEETLNTFVSSGKLIPLIANKILDEYKGQKAEIGPTGSVNKMLQEAEAAAYGEINDLLKEGRMTQDVAVQLTDLIQKDIPFEDYKNVVMDLQKQGKVSPEIAKLKIADYRAVRGLRDMAQILSALQGNDVTVSEYATALQRGVKNVELTPEQAQQLLEEYKSLKSAVVPTAPTVAGGGTSDFARLQQRLQQATADNAAPPTTFEAPSAPPTSGEFSDAQLNEQRQLESQLAQQRSAAIDAMTTSMAGQAQQLVSAWQPVKMEQTAGTPEVPTPAGQAAAGAAGAAATGADQAGKDQATPTGPALIKSGTILFAVLDTAVNSDYPDSPVLATIVDGKYKGTKLMGKLQVTKGVSGQQDRVMLNFTLMNKDDWDASKSVTAFAIDPDTARTVLASNVDYHYMQRFGAIMATSFLQGYASAITQAGTSTTGIFGTSTVHPELSPSQKIATALGQMGQALGDATKNYTNIPPTVKVNSGVGLGILFMADVT